MGADSRANITQPAPRLYRCYADFHTLFGDFHQTLCVRRRHAAHDIHTRCVGVISVHNRRRINVYDVAFLQHDVGRRYAVTNNIVNRRANAFGKTAIVQRGRNSIMLFHIIGGGVVELFGGHPRLYQLGHQIQNAVIDDATLFYAGNVPVIVYYFMRRLALSFQETKAHG